MTAPLTAARSNPLGRLLARFPNAPWSSVAETVARIGYVARGSVYLAVGAVALLAALGLTPHARGALGALEAWGEWPAGVIFLWLIGLGLYGFAGWRALQSIFDVDRQGATAKGLAARAGQAVSGLVYGGLAISVFGLLHAVHHLEQHSKHAAMARTVEKVLTFPFGNMLVILAGLFVLASGVGNIVRAVFSHFGRTLDCDPHIARWAGTVARIGYFARGIALAPVGIFMARAGWHARAVEAHGIGGALEALHRQPMGGLLLSLTALGLMAFGVFAFLEAIFRPIRAAAIQHGD
ncbi:MAG: hypothetical protein JWR47_297 [Phenylobacterium sp.]|jgi:hypothetical protein|uniref:DUF1206 domain-containing protein n=1 Tax=Phenylobacterium sp. TaxID=1871053 RepID=UPI002631CA41|nr:DUF1206 domain-containing protein [Phenylobacterium sp.]MDB5426165.1 hypothetical protein [Phenylobacterium sp.]MDB5434040.1 hypothetical protein [Phenylobacterium sp.]MDB5464686.1 hypothetical protein [Phenylobacterium sp.]MDB5496642.1 hypothetical protein [Phenylobacterium sp.]